MLELSTSTIAILKKFAKINPGITIMPGNVIKTRSTAVYAEARVPETFPEGFGVSDLKAFLSIIGLFAEPMLEFASDHLRICEKDGSAGTQYPYATPGSVTPVVGKRRPVDPSTGELSFVLTLSQFNGLREALRNDALGRGMPMFLTVRSDGNAVHVSVGPKGRVSQAEYSVVVDAHTHGQECEMVFEVGNFPLVPGDYAVTVRPLFTEFRRTDGVDLLYLVAPNPIRSSWGGKKNYQVTVTKSTAQTCVFSVLAHSPEEAEAIVQGKPAEDFAWREQPGVRMEFKASQSDGPDSISSGPTGSA